MARQPRQLAGIGASDLPNQNAVESYKGPPREVVIGADTLRFHDGDTPGGIPVARRDEQFAAINAPGTMAAFIASKIPATQRHIRIGGYYTPGVGAHARKRISTPTTPRPWQVQIADGSWWEYVGEVVDLMAFGARGFPRPGIDQVPPTDAPDDGLALQAAFDFAGLQGGRISAPGNLAFLTKIPLKMRVTRQLPASVGDKRVSFMDVSRFEFAPHMQLELWAGAAMEVLIDLTFNVDFGNIAPFTTKVANLRLRGNNLADYGFRSNYCALVEYCYNNHLGFKEAGVDWQGYGGASIHDNNFDGICGIRFIDGGGDSIIWRNGFYGPNNAKHIKIGILGGNSPIFSNTFNGEEQSGQVAVCLTNDGAAGLTPIRHVRVFDNEFSGMEIGVETVPYIDANSNKQRFYGIKVYGNHITQGARNIRNAANLVVFRSVYGGGSAVHDNSCNSDLQGPGDLCPLQFFDCRRIKVFDNVIENYKLQAAYMYQCSEMEFYKNTVLDVGKSASDGVILELDQTVGSALNDNTITQTSGTYAQFGLLERVGCTGNEGVRNKWSGVSITGVIASGSNSVFRRFSGSFAEGAASQNASTASVSGGRNMTVTRASQGRTSIVFSTAHPDANYTTKVTGLGCKTWVESKTANGFTVLMLGLDDSPIDASFDVEVTSRAA